MKLWSFVDDWIETLLLTMCGLTAAWTWFSWFSVVAMTVGCFALVRLVTEIVGRIQLRRRTKYVTRDGLIVVGDRVPKMEYVDKIVRQIVEWCHEDSGLFTLNQLQNVFDGVVVEFVEAPFANWDLDACPWPLLPWEDGKWIRVGLNKDGRAPALPYELMSCILFHVGNYKSQGVRQAVIDDIGFDLNG